MVSAFFIVMGGFAFDMSHLSQDVHYIAVTPDGFLTFAREQFIRPQILNNDEIADRSKADSLGKLLVCVQALWMVINCIAPKASGLPTTLVELNVVVHVVVTVIVYGLWWHKPLAVAHPIFLPSLGAAGTDSDEEPATASIQPKGPTLADLAFMLWKTQLLGVDIGVSDRRFDPVEHLPFDANHTMLRDMVDFELYIPDESKFELRGGRELYDNRINSISTSIRNNPKSRVPGVLLLHHQSLLLNGMEISITPRNGLAAIFSKDDFRCLELTLLYMKKLTR